MSRWRARVTMRLCLLGAELVINCANFLRRQDLLRAHGAHRAFVCASWLTAKGLRAWRRDVFARRK